MKTNTAVRKPLNHGDLFGEFSRYKLVRHISQRGPEFPPCWMVEDAERPDPESGLPDIIRIAATVEEAIAGLID